MKYYIITIALFAHALIYSQGVSINTTGNAADASAMLDISSTTSGLLIPRMDSATIAGISLPATSLLVYQTDKDSGFYFYDGTNWTPFLIRGTAANSGWSTKGNTGTNPSNNFIGTTDANDWVIRTNNSERARVMSDGRVGIGTNNPSGLSALHVVSSTDSTQFVKLDHTGSSNTTLWLGDPNTITNETGVYLRSSTKGHLGTAGGALIFNIGSSERMRVHSGNGNVGINETNPQQKLHVTGVIRQEGTGDFKYEMYDSETDDWALATNDDVSPANEGFGIYNIDDSAYRLYIQDSDGNIGIGDTQPDQKLHISGNILAESTGPTLYLKDNNSTVGSNGHQNHVRFTDQNDATTGIIGFSGSSQGMSIQNANSGSGHIQFSTGGLTNAVIFNHAGNVSIGTTSSVITQKLVVNGNIAPGATNNNDLGTSSLRWRTIYLVNAPNVSSDRRLKKQIKPLSYGLAALLKMHPVSYQLKDGDNNKHLGFIAQDLEKITPEVVDMGDNNMLGVRYTELIPVLTKAIQEQQEIIEKITTKNSNQDIQINTLKAEIERINNMLEGKASK